MSAKYPNMPLNTQISFGYSRYLDLHIYNMDLHKNTEHYGLCHVLAYKEISSFSYTPSSSNIHHRYKHAVVPISLHRAQTRNTLQSDVDHHQHFMSRIIRSRMQDPSEVRKKTLKFFRVKKANKAKKSPKNRIFRNFVSLKFDGGSKRHLFIQTLIQKCFKSKLMTLYRSGSNLGSLICPKRRVIRMLSSLLK